MKAVILVFILFLSTTNDISFCHGSSHVMNCIESERQALLTFKQHLTDPSNRLSSWALDNNYCCQWVGVVCDNLTAHVTELHLQNPYSYGTKYEVYKRSSLGGKINSSLLNLKHLSYLDLSNNDFGGIQIPNFIGSLGSLRYLNFSLAGFSGMIPYQLGNLSSLLHLGLREYDYAGLYVENLQWISGLSSLEHLDLSTVNLAKASNWLQVINMIPSLIELHLSFCQLDGNIRPPPHINFTSLSILDLSVNYFNSIPNWLYSCNHLESLTLRVNNLLGMISSAVGNLTFLTLLDLSDNQLEGVIPSTVGNLASLTSLDLSWNQLDGAIPSTIGNLASLTSLDLSWNQHEGAIPSTVGNFASLTSLDLSHNQHDGAIPSTVGNLASLTSLDLSHNQLEGAIPSTVGNLASLTSLDLSMNQLEGAIPSTIGNLASLTSLNLSVNQLEGAIPSTVGNLTSLTSLDLSYNQLERAIPRSMENLCNLKVLDLSNNKLFGPLPDQLGQFVNLVHLSLEYNSISGRIPTSLGSLSSLKVFHIRNNQLNGTLPESLGHLSELLVLDISNNFLEGVVSEVHFANLTNLEILNAPRNSLVLKVSPDWIPCFHLAYINLRSWHLGPKFPMWLKSQQNLQFLDLSNTRISINYIPIWFWNLSESIYLASNQLSSPLPHISYGLIDLDLSNNSFFGNISHFLCDSNNESNMLRVLDLGKNLLSGEIPDCWVNWQFLKFINLEDNNFTGNIPSSMRYLNGLQSLHLRNNSLSGEIPSSLQNCTSLITLDLGLNEFEGSIPTWMGSNLSVLSVLSLRSNKLNGKIPLELCHLSYLQIMDLAENNLSGTIPHCFSNLKKMARKEFFGGPIDYSFYESSAEVVENVVVVTKGKEFQYDRILRLVASLDLSSNNLSGEVPKELTTLLGLRSLNLSNNHLIGRIPDKIGNMELLESLDFSRNQFFGKIPPSISNLTFLSYLNLSYNNLSGEIPLSTQLQSLNASSFIGNQLCGPPLTENCSADGIPPNAGNGRDEGGDGFRVKWFYLSMMMGFVVGFWSVCGPLLFNKSWRCAYFRFLDQKWDNLCYRFYNIF